MSVFNLEGQKSCYTEVSIALACSSLGLMYMVQSKGVALIVLVHHWLSVAVAYYLHLYCVHYITFQANNHESKTGCMHAITHHN